MNLAKTSFSREILACEITSAVTYSAPLRYVSCKKLQLSDRLRISGAGGAERQQSDNRATTRDNMRIQSLHSYVN
jgi:hypothetical protein